VVTALVTWLVAMNPVVRFTGDAGCPTAAEVDGRLSALLPTASPSGERDVAALEESGSRLRVTVRRPDGRTLGERELDRGHSCADLAAAIALVIATWESDVHPEFVLALPALAEPARPSPIAPSGPAVDRSSAERAPPVAEATRERRAAAAVAAPPETPREAFDLGAALVASAAPHTLDGSFESDLVAAAGIAAGWVHHGRGTGARLALGIAADRVVPLGPGEAHWRRATVAFGPQYRLFIAGTTILDLHGEVTAAGLNVRGQRFATNDDGWSFDLGAGAGARLWMGTGAWRPWVDLSVAVWPTEHVVYAAPSREGVSLPAVEISLALGMAFFRS
jgi:hypothetical protein